MSMTIDLLILLFFFFNDTATTEIYTLSLHDALPISPPTSRPTFACQRAAARRPPAFTGSRTGTPMRTRTANRYIRSEEHTSELQSRQYLVCRLLLEKKKNYHIYSILSQDLLYYSLTS